MQAELKTELRLEGYDKCAFVCDHDLPLGQIYDYACALKHFISSKIQELEDPKTPTEESQG